MPKITAILLLIIHLSSSVCYSFIFEYFINRSDTAVVQHLDQTTYTDAELIEIAVPLHMPYSVSQHEYQRYDGSIEFNGTQYNYVKRKVSNDTLHLLCLPNAQKTQLYAVKNNYTKQMSDAPSGKKESDAPIKKSTFSSEYNDQVIRYNFTTTQTLTKKIKTVSTSLLILYFVNAPAKPPQVIA